MYNSQNGSYSVANSSVCQSCGNVTLSYEKSTSNKGTLYAVLGWVFFAISLLFMPLLFGAAALFMGFMTYTVKSEIHGLILMVFGAVGLVLGSLFSFIVAGTMFI